MSASVEGWTPEFAGQRPPFQPGHALSLRHGAFSPRHVNPLAREIVEELLADPAVAYVAAPRFRAAVWSWARAEARVQLLERWVENHDDGGVDEDGSVSPVLTALRLWHVRAANQLSKLGLDPMSAARLGRDVAAGEVDMARLMAELAARDEQAAMEQVSDEGDKQT